jgi:hypothetical protein
MGEKLFMNRILDCSALHLALLTLGLGPAAAPAAEEVLVPVLCYHRFGPTVADGMTVTTKVFEAQMKWLKDNGYTVIPLRTLVNYLRGQGPPPPPKSVVITADDAHKTVYTEMWPVVRKYNIPVTLFVYPSCVSKASYAMTWEQLAELKKTGLFDMQSHTYLASQFQEGKEKAQARGVSKAGGHPAQEGQELFGEKVRHQGGRAGLALRHL